MSEPTFREVQWPAPWIIWPLVGLFLVLSAGVGVADPDGWVAAVAMLTAAGAVAVAGVLMRLVTEVRADGVAVRLIPFPTRLIRFEEIASAEAVTYRPLREYGGWGLRFSRRGRAYSASGNRGVQLVLTDGRRVLIGSHRADELEAAIAAGMPVCV